MPASFVMMAAGFTIALSPTLQDECSSYQNTCSFRHDSCRLCQNAHTYFAGYTCSIRQDACLLYMMPSRFVHHTLIHFAGRLLHSLRHLFFFYSDAFCFSLKALQTNANHLSIAVKGPQCEARGPFERAECSTGQPGCPHGQAGSRHYGALGPHRPAGGRHQEAPGRYREAGCSQHAVGGSDSESGCAYRPAGGIRRQSWDCRWSLSAYLLSKFTQDIAARVFGCWADARYIPTSE